MAVTFKVTEGSAKGKVFTFTEHDTFLFGRMAECHATFPDDTFVSRHHFILEACPPKAALRDLGILNGTRVNGKKGTSLNRVGVCGKFRLAQRRGGAESVWK